MLTKKQAMRLLGISSATMSRWMASGKIRFSKRDAERFAASVFFDESEIERLLPKPVSESDTRPTEVSSHDGMKPPTAPTQPNCARPESKPIKSWAEKFADGEAPDSCGNYRDGFNPQWPRTGATLLGPVTDPAPLRSTARDTDNHMPAGVRKDVGGTSGNTAYLNSPEYSLKSGWITQEQYDTLTENATKARRLTGQAAKEFVDRAAMEHAFKFGYSR